MWSQVKCLFQDQVNSAGALFPLFPLPVNHLDRLLLLAASLPTDYERRGRVTL